MYTLAQDRVERMPGLCVSRAAVRVRVLSQYKKESSFIGLSNEIHDLRLNKYLAESESSNRIMVVVDPNYGTKGAMEWALSHTLHTQDTVILLHVATKDGKGNEDIDERAYNLLQAMKNLCQLRRSEVHVEIAIREGKEKGATIVEAAKQLRASLLVLGQRKQSFLRRLQIWKRKRTSRSRVVDYCIQNAGCVAIAVRRRNRKHGGGYLITTKRHKNFWLLA